MTIGLVLIGIPLLAGYLCIAFAGIPDTPLDSRTQVDRLPHNGHLSNGLGARTHGRHT